MKRFSLFYFIFISLLGLAISFAGYPQSLKIAETGEPVYTAYNIWTTGNGTTPYNILRAAIGTIRMYCVNYKSGPNFIPAGTEVYVDDLYVNADLNHVDNNIPSSIQDKANRIQFKVAETGKTYKIYMHERYHPGKSIGYYYKRMFTTKNFNQLTEELTAYEIEAIKKGTVFEGMSKRAVLISYGYPPEHKTKSLKSAVWTYWMTPKDQKTIHFDPDIKNSTNTQVKQANVESPKANVVAPEKPVEKENRGQKTCTVNQLLEMKKIGMTDNQIKAACNN